VSARDRQPQPEGDVKWADRCTTCGEPTELVATMYGGTQKVHAATGEFLCDQGKRPKRRR